ncbi:MAG TPA: hypothetical protein VNW51_08365 [Mucilaginibacter sp.]|jgi:hypothetical protein|nr:hypothetical protein [Mucilaginibacter sp.]
MEGQILKVAISDMALVSLGQIYKYGVETFAFIAATVFIDELIERIEQLSSDYLLHPVITSRMQVSCYQIKNVSKFNLCELYSNL